MRKFVNLTNHKLNQDQIAEVEKMKAKLVEKDEFLPPEIIKQLQNTPSNAEELKKLAENVVNHLKNIVNAGDFLHLPIGSPAFMWLMQEAIKKELPYIKIVFSHTERIVKENEKGEKISVFKFEKFIEV
jgi:hypothetical protein